MAGDVVLRPVDTTGEDDIRTAYAIVRECETRGGGYSDSTLESVRAQLTGPDAVPSAHRMALVDGTPCGLLIVERSQGSSEVFVDAYGVGTVGGVVEATLIEDGLNQVRAMPGVVRVEAGAYGSDDRYPGVLQSFGFTAVRRFWRMRQDLVGVSSDAPPPPPGVTVRVVEDQEDWRLLHAMRELTFADHYGNEVRTFEHYVDVLTSAAGTDPAGLWLVLVDGEPVGLCIVDDSHAEFDEGYVRTLGVAPSARGRGIARWLLARAAAYAVARGRVANALTVDGENTTGATRLYLSAGYEVREVIDVYALLLADASADSR